jgi:hypothetical protein
MEPEVKEVTLLEMKEALAARDAELDYRDLFFLMMVGCTGYDNMSADDIIEQWICIEGITDTLIVIKKDEDSDWTFEFYVDEDGNYELGDVGP